MDPDANLKEQREIAKAMLDPESEYVDSGDALRLAELQTALDEWLMSGGFLPRDWRR